MTMPLPGVEGGCPPECDDGRILLDDGFVLPCSSCRPAQFAACVKGCYKPDHDREKCRECQARASGQTQARTTAPRRVFS